MPRLDFWYEFASTYSFLTAMRIEKAASVAGVEIAWRPFLLGPIFRSQGWDTSPFNLYPAKGRYMVRDLERSAAALGTTFKLPKQFPSNSLLAARLAVVGCEEGWVAPFSRRVFEQEFAGEADISDKSVLAGILGELNLAPEPLFERAAQDDVKSKLRSSTEHAISLGIFGAPSFVTVDGELFWGDDRLDQALRWAQRA